MSFQTKQSINIQQLRESLKLKWLTYYAKNRSWLIQMQIWGTYDGQRRPTSGFILGILSQLDPDLIELLPLILDLNKNPDQIISALGLNFNPDKHLNLVKPDKQSSNTEIKALPSMAIVNRVGNESKPVSGTINTEFDHTINSMSNLQRQLPAGQLSPKPSNLACWIDEFCQGASWDKDEAIVIPF